MKWGSYIGSDGGLKRGICILITRGKDTIVDLFDDVFRRQEGHINVKLWKK